MQVTKTSQLTGRTHKREVDVTPEQMAELNSPNRRLVQDIVPHLPDEEREFLISGITPEEWDSYFGDVEEA